MATRSRIGVPSGGTKKAPRGAIYRFRKSHILPWERSRRLLSLSLAPVTANGEHWTACACISLSFSGYGLHGQIGYSPEFDVLDGMGRRLVPFRLVLRVYERVELNDALGILLEDVFRTILKTRNAPPETRTRDAWFRRKNSKKKNQIRIRLNIFN